MKQILFAAFALFFFMLSVRADSANGPLQVTAPAGWKIKYESPNGIEFYSLTSTPKTPGDVTLLMFSRFPAPMDETKMSGFLDMIASGFLNAAKKDNRIKLVSPTYTKGDFAGDTFSGKYIVFTLENGMKQTMVMFTDGQEMWNGQYTGSSSGWDQAIEVLKGIKKNG